MSSKPVLLQLSGIVHHVVRFDRTYRFESFTLLFSVSTTVALPVW